MQDSPGTTAITAGDIAASLPIPARTFCRDRVSYTRMIYGYDPNSNYIHNTCNIITNEYKNTPLIIIISFIAMGNLGPLQRLPSMLSSMGY